MAKAGLLEINLYKSLEIEISIIHKILECLFSFYEYKLIDVIKMTNLSFQDESF